MKKIILLGSKPTFDLTTRILEKNFKRKISLSCVVTNKKRFEKNFSNCKSKPYFISDSKRNEKKIITFIKKNKLDFLFSIQHKWILSENFLPYKQLAIQNGLIILRVSLRERRPSLR